MDLKQHRLWNLLLFFWIALIAVLSLYLFFEKKEEILNMAEVDAVANFNKDLAYRRWAVTHGGVYVPITKETPSNPYLGHIPERDIVTPSGKKLTLMNPAYMTRQVYELGTDLYDTQVHITSLNPLNPNNFFDEWESKALQSFEKGTAVVSGTETIDGQEHLRVMYPMVTEERCLKCHEKQGYKVGDIRGGISVSVPLAPYNDIFIRELQRTSLGLGALFVFGVVVLLLARRNSIRQMRVISDINGRVQKSEARLREAQSLAHLGHWELNLGTNKLDWSNEVFSIFEIDRSVFEASYEAFLDAIHPDDRALVDKAYADSLETRSSYIIDHRLLMKDGRIKFVNERCGTEYDAEGNPIRSFGTVQDITKRKRAEEKLRESEEKFKTLFERESDAIFIFDPDTTEIIDANKTTSERYGYGKDELIGMSCLNLSAEHEESAATVEKIREHDEVTVPSRLHRKKDGTVFPVAISAYAISLGGKKLMFAVSKDITEQRRAEEQRLALEEQLLQAQKLEAIGTLAGGIAHDFNNILAAIVGYTELTLDETEEGSTENKNLSAVLTAAQKATELVEQIRMFSRKDDEGKEPIQIHLVVEEAAKLLRLAIPTTIAINTEIDHHTGVVLADATQMHQIVMNLGTNAYHAMRKAGDELAISLEPVEVDQAIAAKYPGLQEGPFALLTVTDTGAGMDPVTMSRIFDPFFTTKDIGEGAGMGLSVVHGILQNHGGVIGVESSLGAGATFKIFLPLV